MESFLDPKVEELLADKSETERLQAIAFSIACLCTGPTPFQPPDYYHIPKRTVTETDDEEEDENEDEEDDEETEGTSEK
ncbi:unnamed protein product [Porites lobata]|uniref:Uncharacterized protein n=1 Tax=Porites lobata TaxID=104759 RepID=A0ABN8Q723_9CNID|nr:unnamed protein product [Porites lobata]